MSSKLVSRPTKLFLLLIGATVVALAAQYRVVGREPSLLIWVPWSIFLLFFGVGPFLYSYLQPEAKQTARHDFIDLYIKIASSVLVIAGLIVAWLNFSHEREKTSYSLELGKVTLENSLEEQRSQRFVKALEGLGGASAFQHLAGVYAFKLLDEEFKNRADVEAKCFELKAAEKTTDLAKLELEWNRDKEKHWAIVETLTHYVRQTPRRSVEPAEENRIIEVHEILKYLGKRNLVYHFGEYFNANEPYQQQQKEGCLAVDPADEAKRLNLIGADLRMYDFNSGHFQGAIFDLAELNRSDFNCANLRNARFDGTDLSGANLKNADLSYATFRGANLEGANLTGADITGVDLSRAAMNDGTTCPNGQRPVPASCPNGQCPDPTSLTCAPTPPNTSSCKQRKRGRS
ncbi:MAG TPA: pentapeptide repeat-containing protein [Pyrinomonadaceae bacterium]|nr:pentapeptide repeat-containing protein [Pyrinomonadaceae bacterium]